MCDGGGAEGEVAVDGEWVTAQVVAPALIGADVEQERSNTNISSTSPRGRVYRLTLDAPRRA